MKRKKVTLRKEHQLLCEGSKGIEKWVGKWANNIYPSHTKI